MNFSNLQKKYLDGELTPEEEDQFQKKVSEDPVFREEIAILNEIERSFVRSELSKFDTIVSEVEKEFFEEQERKEEKRLSKIIRLSPFGKRIAAASVITIAASSMFFFSSRKTDLSTETLYKDYFSPYNVDVIRRGEARESDFEKWVLIYKDGDYNRFLTDSPKSFESAFQQNMAVLLKGVASLEVDKPENARKILEKLEKGSDPLFIAHAKWYIALCYLKEGEADKTSELLDYLIENDRYYKASAKELKKKLKS